MSTYINDELKNILDVHFSQKHKEIRRLYPDEKDWYEDKIYYSIENNLKFLEQKIIKNVKDKKKINQIFNLSMKYANAYDLYYNNNKIDDSIKEKNEVTNYDPDLIQAYKINKLFTDEEKKLLNREFNNNIKYKSGRLLLDFNLDSNEKIKVNKAYYVVNKKEIINLKRDFEDLTLKQAIILLDEFKLKGAKQYINYKRKELEYKNEGINDIYKYTMYLMMNLKKDIKSAKRAMIFAQHNNLDIKVPFRYAVSFNDKNINDVVNYYYSVCTEDVEIFINYFESQNKFLKPKIKLWLSDIVKDFKSVKAK